MEERFAQVVVAIYVLSNGTSKMFCNIVASICIQFNSVSFFVQWECYGGNPNFELWTERGYCSNHIQQWAWENQRAIVEFDRTFTHSGSSNVLVSRRKVGAWFTRDNVSHRGENGIRLLNRDLHGSTSCDWCDCKNLADGKSSLSDYVYNMNLFKLPLRLTINVCFAISKVPIMHQSRNREMYSQYSDWPWRPRKRRFVRSRISTSDTCVSLPEKYNSMLLKFPSMNLATIGVQIVVVELPARNRLFLSK